MSKKVLSFGSQKITLLQKCSQLEQKLYIRYVISQTVRVFRTKHFVPLRFQCRSTYVSQYFAVGHWQTCRVSRSVILPTGSTPSTSSSTSCCCCCCCGLSTVSRTFFVSSKRDCKNAYVPVLFKCRDLCKLIRFFIFTYIQTIGGTLRNLRESDTAR